MPGFYPEDEYDLAGYCTGVVDREKIIDNKTMAAGDVVIALPSSGVHSNGFSLVRKVFDVENDCPKDLLESLLTPTKLYVRPVLALLEQVNVKSIAHITGGGFFENIPRALPQGLTAHIRREDVRVLPIFDRIAASGDIPERDMFNTFNMGVGMVVVVSPADADKALEVLQAAGEDAYVLGTVQEGTEGVVLA
jgi:phosphoribosylformylglycinamidine cyclo-ligase